MKVEPEFDEVNAWREPIRNRGSLDDEPGPFEEPSTTLTGADADSMSSGATEGRETLLEQEPTDALSVPTPGDHSPSEASGSVFLPIEIAAESNDRWRGTGFDDEKARARLREKIHELRPLGRREELGRVTVEEEKDGCGVIESIFADR